MLIAELALGKRLPRKAVVHHIDGDGKNNAHANLVVCQNQAYHMLLHVRSEAYAATGNASARRCLECGRYVLPGDPESLWYRFGRYERIVHRACNRLRCRQAYLRRTGRA